MAHTDAMTHSHRDTGVDNLIHHNDEVQEFDNSSFNLEILMEKVNKTTQGKTFSALDYPDNVSVRSRHSLRSERSNNSFRLSDLAVENARITLEMEKRQKQRQIED